MNQEKAIIIKIDGQTRRVAYESYLKAALRMVQDFGYPSLTLDEVREQAEKILANDDLTVIGMIMKDSIAEDQSEA